MRNEDILFRQGIAQIISTSVTTTMETLFNVSIDVCENMQQESSADYVVCCGDLVQDDAHATLMFLFDLNLIKLLVHRTFAAEDLENAEMYESAALEVVNIIGNKLKSYLNVRGYKLEMVIPYVPDRNHSMPAENPMVHMAFSLKDAASMDVDFYLRSA